MLFEVEQKFPISDLFDVEGRLAAMGAPVGPPMEQCDRYFNHPSRDFARTDEALRLRSVGDTNVATYKGPKLDRAVKTRRELELPLAPGGSGAAGFAALLEALGFRLVATVRKRRRTAAVSWRGRTVTVAVDDVEGLGRFCELELCVPPESIDDAKRGVASLAAALGLTQPEPRSYLEMVLARGT